MTNATKPSFYSWIQIFDEELFDHYQDDTLIVSNSVGGECTPGEEVDHHWLWQRRVPLDIELEFNTSHDLYLLTKIEEYNKS